MGKSDNYYFLITIAALGLKVAWSIQLNKLMKWSSVSIKGQGHALTLVKGHSDFNVKTCFSQNSWAIWNQSSYESLRENENENLYKWVESQNQYGRPAHIWEKP